MSKSLALLAVGGAHPDRRGQVAGAYVPGASNPGSMRESIGGGVFNAARVAAASGLQVSLVSVRGGDASGAMVEAAIAGAGLADLSPTFLDRRTPSYTSLLDRSGEQIAGLADMALYDVAFARILRRKPVRAALAAADAVLCDANPSSEALEALAVAAGGKPLHAIAVSPAKVVRLAPLLPQLACLFMNRAEAVALAAAVTSKGPANPLDAVAGAGLRAAVITGGAGPLAVLQNGRQTTLLPPQAEALRDVTGAGDALAGATVAALMAGADLREALLHGMAAAAATVETRDSIASPDRMTRYLDEARRLNP
ncbi:MAG: carbohydrate kinase [Notoacmeibacter sp.]|nr:carbohydrate kinase [Notoacmeibacter sp.]MCC0032971.1 carbohydrate kinase [Brucellaceae bacterium]